MDDLKTKTFNVEISNHALGGKTLPKRLKVLSWGKNTTTQGDVILNNDTVKMFDSFMKKSGRYGKNEVALDFDHCTVPGSKEYVAGEPKNIAAYGTAELIPNDGLYLNDLEWTPLGKEKASNYQDLSPAVKMAKDDVTVEGLHSVALTPNGAVKGLKFYSAEIAEMIKHMSIKDYNKDDANAGVKQVGDKYEVNMKPCDVDEMGEDVSAFDSDDHFSKYGDVDYADKDNHKYPIDTKEHVKAAWSYINMPKNSGKYDSTKLSTIKGHIKTAAKNFGINIADSGDKTKTMSANSFQIPDAYRAQEPYLNTMNDSIIKSMASELDMENETDAQKVLNAFLAKYLGLKSQVDGLIINKDNTEEGGLKQFSATVSELKSKIEQLEIQNKNQAKVHAESEKETLMKQASRDGKFVSLSADTIKKIDVEILREIVANAPKNKVPVTSQLKTLSAGEIQSKRDALINRLNDKINASK